MAYVDPQDDEELQRQQQQNGLVIAGTDLSGANAGATTPGATTGAAVAPNQSPNQTSGFTDVAAYLNANKDQSAQMAGQIAGTLNTEYDKTRGDIDTAANAFKTNVDQNTVNPNADLVNRAAANPLSVANDPSQLAAFQAQRKANYAGPTQFESDAGYGTAANEVSKEQSRAQLASNPAQRGQLLYSLGDNPTSGQVSLDSLLLGADPNSQATLSGAASKFPALSDYLGGKATDLDAQAASAKANTNQASQLVADKFTGAGGVIPTFQQGLSDQTQKAGQLEANYNNQVNDITARLQAGQSLTPDEMAAIKVQPGMIERLNAINNQYAGQRFVNPADYLVGTKPMTGQPSAGTVASAEDYQKAAALQQLMGLDQPIMGLSDPTQAGTFSIPTGAGSFDYAAANTNATEALKDADKSFLDAGIPLAGADYNAWTGNFNNAAGRQLYLQGQAPAPPTSYKNGDYPQTPPTFGGAIYAGPANDFYSRDYSTFAPDAPQVTLGGGISNLGGDPNIDPLTGKPYVYNPNGTNTATAGSGKAFR